MSAANALVVQPSGARLNGLVVDRRSWRSRLLVTMVLMVLLFAV